MVKRLDRFTYEDLTDMNRSDALPSFISYIYNVRLNSRLVAPRHLILTNPQARLMTDSTFQSTFGLPVV